MNRESKIGESYRSAIYTHNAAQCIIELHSPIERVIVTSASSSIIIHNWFQWLVDKASVQFLDIFFIVSYKYDVVFLQSFSWPCCITSWIGIWLSNARWDLGIRETLRSKLPAPVSRHRIRVGIVHIVSIKCIAWFLVTGHVSANVQLKVWASIEDGH